MNNKKNGIPKLRFPGFTGAWEQRKLGEIFEIQSGFTGDAQLNTGKFKVSRIETISNGVIDSKKIGFSNVIPDKKYKLNVGDILYSNINSIDHIGKIAEYIEDIGLYHGINLLRLASISDNPDFLFYELNTEEKRNWAKSHANKAVNQASINQTELKKQKLSIPVIEEQTKISNFLQHFDSLITLHQRKLEHLQEQKKGLLQKMFPKKGETVPEVRFPGFTDAWEQRKLGGVAKFYSGGTPSVGVSDYYDGTIPFIRSAEINSTSTELYLSELGLQNSSAKMVHRGDILYALYGATSGEVGISKINGAINQAILAIIPHKGYNSEFLEQWLRKNKEAIIKTYLQGGQGNLSGAIVKQIKVSFPSFDEQQKIGKSFQKIDSLITLHQRKLDHLELMKKGLLQQMFV